MGDPNIQRQISEVMNLKRGYERSITSTQQTIRALERQGTEARRLPDGARAQQRLKEQIRQLQRDIERHKQDIRTCDRQLADFKRLDR